MIYFFIHLYLIKKQSIMRTLALNVQYPDPKDPEVTHENCVLKITIPADRMKEGVQSSDYALFQFGTANYNEEEFSYDIIEEHFRAYVPIAGMQLFLKGM